MSKKANPTLLGLFIVAGLALGIGAILLFSSAHWFSKTQKYILYFDTSVLGLNEGAPVNFRGVKVGVVHEVLIRFNQAESDLHMPVIIEVDEKLLREKTGSDVVLTDKNRFEALVKQGLRGKLEALSFITGLLYVELEVLPAAPPARFHQLKPVYPEIPTAPTRIQALMDNLAEVDFKKLFGQMTLLMDRLDANLSNLKLAEINTGITNLLASLNQLAGSAALTNALVSVQATMDEYRRLSETVRGKVDPLAVGADGTLKDAQLTLAEMRHAIQDLRDVLAPEAPLRRDVAAAMEQLSEAGRSIAALADFLNRYPNALLGGRKPPSTP